jgi:ketosteroid isomerase-like protein
MSPEVADVSGGAHEKDLATVHGIYQAYARKDVDAFLAALDPEVELCQSDELPWGGTYHGREGALEFLERLTGQVETTVDPRQFIVAGDRVVEVGYSRGRTKQGAAEFEIPEVHVWTMRDGKVIRFESYLDTVQMRRVLDASSTVSSA